MTHSIPLQQSLWESLVALAKKKRKKPSSLVQQAVRDFLQRVADEDLLAESDHQARKTGMNADNVESLIARHRIKARA